jgi:tRNA(fMet)-specific endonuclease VapC
VRVCIDTNRYKDFCSGLAETVECLRRAEKIFVPFVVLAELRAGFACGTMSRENEAVLTRFLNADRVELIYPDESSTHHFARIYYQLRTAGTPIPTHDMWIAALVIQHDLVLHSRDAHFDQLPQLARE